MALFKIVAANTLETHPVVDGKSGNLECHRDHVDGAVQQGRLKLLLQVDLLRSGQEQRELALEQKIRADMMATFLSKDQ